MNSYAAGIRRLSNFTAIFDILKSPPQSKRGEREKKACALNKYSGQFVDSNYSRGTKKIQIGESGFPHQFVSPTKESVLNKHDEKKC